MVAINNSPISFEALSEEKKKYYNFLYRDRQEYLPVSADKYIVKKLESNFPNAENTDVLEIGAGNGRNALEIAKKSYNMTAAELAKSGQDLMIKQAAEYKLDNLSTTGEDFLKNKNKNKFDFIFMSHVSQHFDFKDLNNSLKSINNMLKTNGVAV
ncbi:MAG: class I SAM-dependent methyltransferase, partial [Candidatus Gastranaerophilales bacterium]|nr:class I SAM-dependent methyltransferase [Candidatus Gastranaerophilales bacterium]